MWVVVGMELAGVRVSDSPRYVDTGPVPGPVEVFVAPGTAHDHPAEVVPLPVDPDLELHQETVPRCFATGELLHNLNIHSPAALKAGHLGGQVDLGPGPTDDPLVDRGTARREPGERCERFTNPERITTTTPRPLPTIQPLQLGGKEVHEVHRVHLIPVGHGRWAASPYVRSRRRLLVVSARSGRCRARSG